ncbi:AAA family ATPase [Leptotrichia sp. oral taxon 847]|uniref:AAA family ATPase n=1 Tax=Leptotrichia sp. oral taxon 847 TaxID=1785996 RepID=UPI0007681683|nr:AAA family ATPase [Leptotrichia sp. oral taxon 847]AMD94293.1 9-O-acetyl-N-acetylneuraminate esterase [Leptotrichia sp. oral taxon 847]
MDKKAVPVGIEDFERIINESYYYVDKSMLIEDLLINRAPVTLFTRPRRFGKTLNMSMFKYFFDVKNKEENKKLFENLKISSSKYMSEQGKYPVIFISLKDLKEDTWEECLESIKNIMYKIFNEYSFLREKLNIVEKRQFDKVWEITGNERNFKTSLLDLSNYLNKYYGEKVIILIDEYDAPIINAFDKGYYNEAINFFQTFYSSALKTNNSLKYGVLTGITRIIKEGIFSGLNNLYVNTILSKNYSEYFGLLECEVVEMLEYFDMKYKIEEVREWYDGYIFGESKVYNPWSIVNYIREKEIKAYWANVSGNTLLENMLDHAGESVYDDLKRFTDGESIEKYILDGTTIKSVLRNDDEIWQLLLYSGYLTKDEKQREIDVTSEYTDIYNLRIPNKEIRKYVGNMFLNRFFGTEIKTDILIRALENGDIKRFEKTLGEIMINMLSHFDLDKEMEKIYQVFMIGLVGFLMGKYEIISNDESGYGRYDLAMIPIKSNEKAYLMEFKISKTKKGMEEKAHKALKQIDEKKYDTKLKARGIKNILKIGIAFYGKEVKVVFK